MRHAGLQRSIAGIGVLLAVLVTTAYAVDCNLWSDCGNVFIGSKLGIGSGTQSPVRSLHIKTGSSGSLNYAIRLDSPTGTGTGQLIETTMSTQFGAFQDATSTYSFRVNNATATKLYVGTAGSYDGRVAIGNTTPSAPLSISGFGTVMSFETFGGGVPVGRQRLISAPSEYTAFGAVKTSQPQDQTSFQVINPNTSASKFFVGTVGTYDGNVGIGTTTPANKLEVNGTIKAKEMRVTLTGFPPDYVFEEGYNLTPLEDLEAEIKREKHLPGIPSGKHMTVDGVSVGEMQMLLLKKVEELTLYVIDLDKENAALKAQVAGLAH